MNVGVGPSASSADLHLGRLPARASAACVALVDQPEFGRPDQGQQQLFERLVGVDRTPTVVQFRRRLGPRASTIQNAASTRFMTAGGGPGRSGRHGPIGPDQLSPIRHRHG